MEEKLKKRREEFEKMHAEWGEYNIYQEFLLTAERFPTVPFLIDDDRELSYQETAAIVEALALDFRSKGVKKTSHVALCLEKKSWFVLVSLALYRIGAVKIPTSQRLGRKELLYVLNQSDADCLISETAFPEDFLKQAAKIRLAFAAQVKESNKRTIDLSQIMDNIRTKVPCSDSPVADSYHIREPVQKDLDVRKTIRTFKEEYTKSSHSHLEDVVDIMYTSGSTSMPKGVMLTNQMLLQSAYANDYNRAFYPGRRIFIPIPLHHIFGYVEGVLGAILSGGALVFTDGRFQAEKALKCMEERRVHDILAVPSMMVKMVKSPEFHKTDLSNLHAMYCGASICSETVWQELQDGFGIKEIVTGYGMTELAGATMQTQPGDSVSILKRSLGKLLTYPAMKGEKHWIEYKVIDSGSREPVEDGKIGELLCRGTLVMPGYYNNPEANAETFTEDGWLITGDIAGFDRDGYIEFVGRSNDQCKVNGENVSLQFLDETIGECPDVLAVETVSVADAKSGNAVVAFVECKDANMNIKKEIVDFSRQNLTNYQMPKYFVFGKREEWPQTSSLKVQKNQLHLRAELLLSEGGNQYLAEAYLKKRD